MRTNALRLCAALGIGTAMLACGDSGGGGDGDCPPGQVRCDGPCIDEIAPTLTAIQEAIFDVSCATSACHSDIEPTAEMSLTSTAVSAENLIEVDSVQVEGKLRVAPNDSGASYLVNKITGRGIAPNTLRMPISERFEVLCEPKIDAIRRWIDDGAPVE